MQTEIERLYREHRAGLVRLVQSELHDQNEAEDVVQTAFLDAQRALERGTVPRNPRAWLAAIALNAGRRLRRRRLNAEPLEEFAVQEAAGMPEIRAALASLPEEQRAAVVYRDLLGLSYGETAEKMGTSVNAVTMLLHRGRRRLRQALGVAVGGLGLSRWLRHLAMPQTALVKGAAAVVLASGLATTGVVVAREVAPVGTHTRAAAPTVRSATRAPEPSRHIRRAVFAPDTAARRFTRSGHASVNAASAPTQTASEAGASAPGPASTVQVAATPASSPSTSTLAAPSIVPLPAVTVPTPPATVAATVAVTTPVATVTVTTPAATTVSVTTPITTATLPIP